MILKSIHPGSKIKIKDKEYEVIKISEETTSAKPPFFNIRGIIRVQLKNPEHESMIPTKILIYYSDDELLYLCDNEHDFSDQIRKEDIKILE